MKLLLLKLIMCFLFILQSCTFDEQPRATDKDIDILQYLLHQSRILSDSLPEDAFNVSEQAVRLTDSLEVDEFVMFDVYYQAGIASEAIGNYDLAMTYFSEVLNNLQRDDSALANVYNYMGHIAFEQGNYDAAMEYFSKSLQARLRLRDLDGQASSNLNIGLVFQKKKDYEQASKHYQTSLDLYNQLENRLGQADCYSHLGKLALEQNDMPQALVYFRNSEEIYKEIGDGELLAATYQNIGTVYESMEDTKSAHDYYKQALNISRLLPYAEDIVAEIYCNIGDLFYKMNEPDSAIVYYSEAIELSQIEDLYDVLQTALKKRSFIYAAQGFYREAYNDYSSHKYVYDLLINKETTRTIAQKSMQYEFALRHNEQIFHDYQQRQIIISLSIGILLFCIASLSLYRNSIQKREANTLLKSRQREIKDSLSYASLIQKSSLPSKEYFSSIFPEYFIYYQACNIVSGDFYWVAKKGSYSIVVAADCTGHGVPGAIISMLGISTLDRIIDKILPQADVILNILRDEIIHLLNPIGTTDRRYDGMDIALAIIDTERHEIDYAGAFNPLYIIRDGKLLETKADRMPIGLYEQTENKKFTSNHLKYYSGDMIYLFSDGYADQFGGENGSKLKIRNFKELLVSISSKPLDEQSQILDKKHKEWKGDNFSQTDDILIIGIRL